MRKLLISISMYVEAYLKSIEILSKAVWRKTKSTNKFIFWIIWLKTFIISFFQFTLLTILFRKKGALLIIMYAWLRQVDDVLDGEDKVDIELIRELINEKSLVLEKFKNGTLYLRGLSYTDRLLYFIYKLGKDIDVLDTLQSNLIIVWECMLQDFSWRVDKIIPEPEDLYLFSMKQDEAMFRLIAIPFGVNSEVFKKVNLHKFGIFTRTDWLLDLKSDLRLGLIHIYIDTHCYTSYDSIMKYPPEVLIKDDLVEKRIQYEV
ncbi:MAG: hypothetical protein KGI58_02095, partial [Patescibacteria group bacterium]|nr:hypothetical protein [Patescibacteria group bacterium]